MSRRLSGFTPALCLIASVAGLTSCDWTGGSGSEFNSSRGGANINVSGFYRGAGSGGRVVSRTSGGPITNLTIQQSGNVLEVLDNNGQKYRGNVGSPLAVAAPNDLGVIPTGAQLANFQVNWAGKDGVAAKDIQFAGIINVVAVTDIRATTTRQVKSNDSSSAQQANNININNSSNNSNTTTTNSEGVNGSQVVSTGPGGGTATEVFNNTTTTTTTSGSNSGTNRDSGGVTQSSAQNSASTATEATYGLSDANTQYRLRGTWIENGGVTANVDALSAGAGGVLVVLAAGQNASNFIQPTTLTQPAAVAAPAGAGGANNASTTLQTLLGN